jgi:N-lysine methyltransferase SETD6
LIYEIYVQTRPDLFPPSTLQSFYTLENFHHLGSSILSRSFHVEVWQGEKDHLASEDEEGDDDDDDGRAADESLDGPSGGKTSAVVSDEDAMDIDTTKENHNSEDEGNEDEDEDDDEEREDASDVSMVPMADMLNARHGSDNESDASSFCFPSSPLTLECRRAYFTKKIRSP